MQIYTSPLPVVHLMFNKSIQTIAGLILPGHPGCRSCSEGVHSVHRTGGLQSPVHVLLLMQCSHGESTHLYPFLSSVSVSGPIGRGFTLKSQNRRDVIFKQ